MVVNGRPLKRMKRRITPDLNDFLTFPSLDDHHFSSTNYEDKPFRVNIQSFLAKHAQLPPPSSLFPHLLIWQIVFRIGDLTDGTDSSPSVVTLDVVEEDVARSSRSVYCDQCRVVGWSGHPVCGKRYHFIIRAAGTNSSSMSFDEGGYHKSCLSCGDQLFLSDSRCKSCNHVLSSGEVEQWVYQQLEETRHLLHGVVHGNGYGHLLRVNGKEGGSKYLSGCDIMNFWDRLCRALCVRNLRTHLQDIISFYQSLSDCELLTLRDLFCFLMNRIRRDLASAVSASKKPGVFSSSEMCPWATDDIDRVEQEIVKVLRVVGGYKWVSWRSLKGALCRTGSPELLTYCLKQLGGKVLGDSMVQSRCNSDTNTFEYRVVPSEDNLDDGTLMRTPTLDRLLQDLRFLYDSLLNPQTMISYRPNITRELAVCSASKLLDCKQFVKSYYPQEIPSQNLFVVRLSCEVELLDHPKDYTEPPPELIILPHNFTETDVKTEATKAFQEVYVLFKRFQVEEVIHSTTDTSDPNTFVGTTGSIRVRGRCHEKGLQQFRMERGTENWIVNCTCGAKDDDGERMLACDACGVWQHTRCAGILDVDAVPEKFTCERCGNEENKDSQLVLKTASRPCKDNERENSCGLGGKNMMVPFSVR